MEPWAQGHFGALYGIVEMTFCSYEDNFSNNHKQIYNKMYGNIREILKYKSSSSSQQILSA
jgi:hypothetical protein